MAKRLKLILLLTVTLMTPLSQADSSILPLRVLNDGGTPRIAALAGEHADIR
jgi:hypothetical protein